MKPVRSNDKFWCDVQSSSLFNSDLSPLVACKLSRLGNYQNLSYKQVLKATQNGRLPLCTHCMTFLCAHHALQRLFARLVRPIHQTLHLTIFTGISLHTAVFSFSTSLLGRTFTQDAVFSSLRLGRFRAICCA